MDDATLDRFADLIVTFGANVQPGQIVALHCQPGKETLVRKIAEAAYRHGAKFVDVDWFDPYVKRARIAHAADDTLDFVPSWYGERVLQLGEQRCARIVLSGPVAPGLLEDLDPQRAGRDKLPRIKEAGQVVNDRTTNWTIAPCPTPDWARLVHPDDDPDEALAKLWKQIIHVCRLDEEDPRAVWAQRRDALLEAARKLTDKGYDALRYEGEGTDLTIGLLPGARWMAASFETVDGIPHMPNVPSEEVFSTPDPERTEGVVTSTKPLVLIDGTIVRDLVVEFSNGRVTRIDASAGADVMRTMVAADDGAARLGEVALVDGEGRIGAMDTVFYDTLLDENAASHIALGQGFPFLLDEPERSNTSEIHIDFMIGSEDLKISGVTASGRQEPVLHRGAWHV